MQTMGPGTRLVAGGGGVALIVASFLPWAGLSGASDPTAWDLTAGCAALTIITGLIAMAAAATGGGIGLFRPDVSLRAAADVFAVTSAVVVGVVMLFDMPAGADPASGAVIALLGAAAVAGVCGDYRVLRGAPAFPRLDAGRE